MNDNNNRTAQEMIKELPSMNDKKIRIAW